MMSLSILSVLVLLFCLECNNGFFVNRLSNIFKFKLEMNSKVAGISIRTAENNDIAKIASFLSDNMFDVNIPTAQKRELTRLETADLDDRYSERVGRRTLPSTLLLCEEGKDLVG
jgi:hypothetical protein